MPFEVIENNPIEIDLVKQARTTGWTVDGKYAIHEVCNAGYIFLDGKPIVSGKTYEISFRVVSVNSGFLRFYLGDTAGQIITTPGFNTITVMASGINPEAKFFSDANLKMEVFAIRDTEQSVLLKQQTTIVWNELSNKWPSFYTITPDCAFSMFTSLYTFKRGRTYVHRQNSSSRNNFHGNQFKSIIKFAANKNPDITKSFTTLKYKANQLMITTADGITTSLGQISDLLKSEFLQYELTEGVTKVEVYDIEGEYTAGFLRDKNEDIINGSVLKGDYAIIELITVDNTRLKLFIVEVNSVRSFS